MTAVEFDVLNSMTDVGNVTRTLEAGLKGFLRLSPYLVVQILIWRPFARALHGSVSYRPCLGQGHLKTRAEVARLFPFGQPHTKRLHFAFRHEEINELASGH